jgi:tRNA A37 threonylcarbamoyladenosine dehydratase
MIHDRTIKQFGIETFTKLSNQHVMIVGVGGVGGYAVEALARFGFKHLILVDDDHVESSNINRQLCALQSTLGMSKVAVFKSRIADIDPTITVDTHDQRFNASTKHTIFNQSIDYVIDAIDSLDDKAELIKTCLDHKIPFVSVMGTGNKLAPEQLQVMPLHRTQMDPIARILRKDLKHHPDYKKITTICSFETPTFEERIIGGPTSNAYVPGSAGLLAASVAIRALLKQIEE